MISRIISKIIQESWRTSLLVGHRHTTGGFTHKAKMEHFLESVADSVSQLVLFSVDPNEANKEAASLQEGARIVKQSAHAMQNISRCFLRFPFLFSFLP